MTRARASVERRYDRIAAGYDLFDAPMDWMGGADRRRRVLGRARGDTLEVGIGTGRNLSYYPPGVNLTGIDISARMLARARRRAVRINRQALLEKADVVLPFREDTTTNSPSAVDRRRTAAFVLLCSALSRVS